MLIELGRYNILGKKQGQQAALRAAELMSSSTRFLVVDATSACPLALERFSQAPASISFTDCVVLAVDDQCNTRRLSGFDAYFLQQG